MTRTISYSTPGKLKIELGGGEGRGAVDLWRHGCGSLRDGTKRFFWGEISFVGR